MSTEKERRDFHRQFMKGRDKRMSKFMDLLHRGMRDEIPVEHFGTPDAPVPSKELLRRYSGSWADSGFFPPSLSTAIRTWYTGKFGYHVVTKDIIDVLVPRFYGAQNIVEVMAGTGYLSACLQRRGVNILATDNMSWHHDHGTAWKEPYTEIIEIEAEEAVKDADIVVMCWPYMDMTCMKVVNAMESGALLMYQGEGSYGCTGVAEFWSALNLAEDNDVEDDELNSVHVQFEGIHDRWYTWVKP